MLKNNANIEILLKEFNHELENYILNLETNSQCLNIKSEISNAYIYPLKAGGKRIRPLLLLLTSGAFGGAEGLKTAFKAALAVEKIHTYSLVHDDLPCMDNDDLRRGKPTTHKVYGEAKALLIGDGLLTQAFALLAETQYVQPQNKHYTTFLVQALAQGAGPEGMVWGQWLDIALTGNEKVTWEQMEIVHRNKTGKLLGASLELGFICGLSALNLEVNPVQFKKMREQMREAGILIGLAFQIIDDILDKTKTSAELGKTAGKDEAQFKLTAPILLGMDKATELSQKYTEAALQKIEDIFANELFVNYKNEFSEYKISLIEHINILLARSH
ncbi:polyprenyl synthetase family protein [Fluviispira multicolorata]|uniref:Polyprenyl synthetase family protein n=1 Tax=Fluviispira multicolorata TaxID=2654512 RepID=A0A833JES6_9BACT|nr:polyprenyl synthetase family protein [Fluviispira multicolorata]KAB8030004.1 polyprenyl synthetase family protein [Fluviispira multicolorata]